MLWHNINLPKHTLFLMYQTMYVAAIMITDTFTHTTTVP